MKLGLSMWSYVAPWKRGEIEVPQFIRKAKDLGVEGVEMLDFFYRDQADWEPETAAILRALDETGLPMGVFSVGNDFAQPDPAARTQQVDIIRKGVDMAGVFGAGVVRVFAGGSCEGHSNEEVFGWMADGLAESSLYAAEKGVRLALENHGRVAGRGGQVCALIEEVRAKAGNDALGANPDTGNFLIVNQDSVDGVRGVARYAWMCHFKDFGLMQPDESVRAYVALDGTRYKGTAVGEGDVDLSGCVAALRESGFDGWVNIEYESEEDPRDGVPRSVRAAKGYL